jgi:ankyrin repeat protein
VTRGADLEARNVLGLTALELAIDLSNNDIAFLLLSLRDAGAGAPRGKGTKVAAPAAAPAAAKRPVPAPVKNVAAVREATPRQTTSDGGAPVPSAGFLGFGGGR